MIRLSLLLLMTSSQIALADAVLAARTMRASSILTSADLTQSDADIPGSYTGPASRTWLYYTAEQKHWSNPLRVEITPPTSN